MDTTHARVSNFQQFPKAIHGVANGRPVRLLGFADVEGHSPAYLTVNQNGDSQWESFSDVQIIDTECLPISTSALKSIGNINYAAPTAAGSRR